MLFNILSSTLLGAIAVSGLAQPFGDNSAEERGEYGGVIRVRSGHSIQKAINSASPGSRIIVEAGTYKEQINIDKSGILLIGRGAIIAPPHKAVKNPCTDFAGPGTQAGICVSGKGLEVSDFVVEHKKVKYVKKPVRDVTVSGFQVRDFNGFNVLVLGAVNARVYDNVLTGGGPYGFLTAGSIRTSVYNNVVNSKETKFIGICMDNYSGVRIWENKIANYYIGLCIQTNGAVIENNEVSDSCFGAFLDPGVKDVQLTGNKFIKSLATCGPTGAAGIALDGSIRARVEHNVIRGQKSDGKTAGISIVDDPCSGSQKSLSCLALGKPAVASGNIVKNNYLHDNALDIFVDTKGKGNVVRHNKCSTSVPEKICKK